jgi:peptide/nickel transport system permease protein
MTGDHTTDDATGTTDADRPATDDGAPAGSGRSFENIDWAEVDANRTERSGVEYLWSAVAGVWTFCAGLTALAFVLAPGSLGFPVVGELGLLFWAGTGVLVWAAYAWLRPLRLSRVGVVWVGAVAAWVLAFGLNAYTQLLGPTGELANFPYLGAVQTVDWMWLFTMMVLARYGALPLYRNKRMTAYYWRQFRRNKAAVISGIYLLVILLVGVVGSRVVPAPTPSPGLQKLPPLGISVPSYVSGIECPGLVTEGGQQVCQGTAAHPLGTTQTGEDILQGVIHGMEVSMQVGLIATLISLSIAAAVGLAAVHFGGLVDEVLMRYVDIQQTFPTLFLFLFLAYTLGGSLFLLIFIFGFFGWGNSARLIRAEALQREAMPYIKASKSAGASALWTIRRHLLPNVTNSLITAATLAVPVIILGEATFAFLGLADATIPSWGRLIAQGRESLRNAWWISTIPGVFLFFTILAFNFMGDALRDALDPRHGGEGE